MKQRKTNKKTVLWFTAFLVLILIGIGRPVKAETEGEIRLKGDCYYCYEDHDEGGDGIRIIGIRKGVKNPTIPNKINGKEIRWISINEKFDDGEKNINTFPIPRYVEEYNFITYMQDNTDTIIKSIKIKNYKVHSKNSYFSTKDGCLYSKDGEILIAYPDGRTEKSYTIPKGTINIGAGAFIDSEIEKISMSSSVVYIGNSAFVGSKLKDIKLSDELDGIGESAFYRTDISKIVLPKSLEYIEAFAFEDCKNLKTVIIPKKNRLSLIGTSAFQGCNRLKDFIVPTSKALKVEIENDAFRNCICLEKVELPSALREIGYRSFRNCKNLKRVNIKGAAQIYNYAFYGCESLRKVTLGETMRSVYIQKGVFQKCGKLEKIQILSDAKIGTIHEEAFVKRGEKKNLTIVAKKNSYVYRYAQKHKEQFLAGVSKLTAGKGEVKQKGDCYYCEIQSGIMIVGIRKGVENPTIPNQIDGKKVLWIQLDSKLENGEKNINTLKIPRYVEDYYVPIRSIKVKNYKVHSKNKNYCAKGSCLYSKNGEILIAYPNGKLKKSVTIAKGTIEIGDYAFMESQVEKVSMPNSVKYIGHSAFEKSKLENIKLSSKLEGIDVAAFAGTNICKIIFPKSLKQIGRSAFWKCRKLKTVTIPEKNHLYGIETFAFNGCSRLKKFVYPEPIVDNGHFAYIEEDAFDFCRRLEKVVLPAAVKDIGGEGYVFYYRGYDEKSITIIAPKDSYAYNYAKEHKKQGLKVKALK